MYISRFYYFLLSVYIWHVKLIIYVISVCTCVYPTLQPNSSDGFTVKAKAKGHNWETIGRLHLGGNWETSGRHVGNYWGPHLADNWALRTVEDNWERIGTPHLEQTGGQFGDNWKTTSARHTRDNCVRSGRKNLKDNTSSLLEDQFWRQLGIVEDNSKTTSGKQLGNNWCTWISA